MGRGGLETVEETVGGAITATRDQEAFVFAGLADAGELDCLIKVMDRWGGWGGIAGMVGRSWSIVREAGFRGRGGRGGVGRTVCRH